MGFRLRNTLNQAVPVHISVGGAIKEIRVNPKKYYPEKDGEFLPDTAMNKSVDMLIKKKYLQKINVVEPKPEPVKAPVVEAPVVEVEAAAKETEEIEKKPVEEEVDAKPSVKKKVKKKVVKKKTKRSS